MLRRSKSWRRYGGLTTADVPVDVWRELCWRYVVYPGSYLGRPAEIVFAVFVQQRHPTVHAALVDAATGVAVPWPTGQPGSGRPVLESVRRPAVRPSAAMAGASAPMPSADLPFSSDL